MNTLTNSISASPQNEANPFLQFSYPFQIKLGLAILSGILMFMAFPDYSFFWLMWFSWLPLLVALEGASLRLAYGLGWVCGVTLFLGGFPWLSDMVYIYGWPSPLHLLAPLFYAMVMGHSIALITFLFQWERTHTKISEILLLPCIYISVWNAYPLIFYFHLGAGQLPFLPILQPIEITGIHGMDFVLILLNILLFHCLHPPKRNLSLWTWSLSGLFLISWIGYGFYSYETWEKRIQTWDTKPIGLIQPNRKVSFEEDTPDPGYTYANPWELEQTTQLALQGVPLFIWPEGYFFGFYYWKSIRQNFLKTTQKFNTALIFQDQTFVQKENHKFTYNSAIHITQDGILGGVSHKNHLMPYGEFLPFQPFLDLGLQWFGFEHKSMDAGNTTTIFETNGMKLFPVICYESLFPEYIGEGVRKSGKGVVIVVLSQNGWYGDSFQQVLQHIALTNVRAIENRTPLIHAINNGPSYLITPTGNYQLQTPHLERGSWVGNLSYHPEMGGSFYSQYPNWFLKFIQGITLGYGILLSVVLRFAPHLGSRVLAKQDFL